MAEDEKSNVDTQALALLIEMTARSIYPDRGPFVMHPGQWAVLRFLSTATECQKDLNGVAAHLGITPGPASRAIANLEKKGLVICHVQEEDRRKRKVYLSLTGEKMLINDPIRRAQAAIGQLSNQQQNDLQLMLNSIHAELSQE